MANATETLSQTSDTWRPLVDWRAIIAGTVAAAALFVLLSTFGGAIGLSMTSAEPYAGWSVTVVAIVSAIWFALTNVGTFAVGGYVAGRLRERSPVPKAETSFRDGAHGFLVWSVGTLLTVYLLTSGAASVISGVADAAKTAATGVTAAATGAAPSGADPVGYAVDSMLRRPANAQPATGGTQPAQGGQAQSEARTSQLNSEIARIFVVNLARGQLLPADREHLAGLVRARTGLSAEGQAEKRVDEAWTQVQQLRQEAEATARETAETARRSALIAAFLAAAVALAGLVAAVVGAAAGSRHREAGTDMTIMGARIW